MQAHVVPVGGDESALDSVGPGEPGNASSDDGAGYGGEGAATHADPPSSLSRGARWCWLGLVSKLTIIIKKLAHIVKYTLSV